MSDTMQEQLHQALEILRLFKHLTELSDSRRYQWVGLTPFRSFMTTYATSYKKRFRMSPYHISTMYLYEDPPQGIFKKMAIQKPFPTTQESAASYGNTSKTLIKSYNE